MQKEAKGMERALESEVSRKIQVSVIPAQEFRSM